MTKKTKLRLVVNNGQLMDCTKSLHEEQVLLISDLIKLQNKIKADKLKEAQMANKITSIEDQILTIKGEIYGIRTKPNGSSG